MFTWKKPTVITEENKIEALLDRGVEKIFPNRDFLKARLMKGERLTLYLGIDPTAPTLHLGHVIPMMKLRQFQDLGHQIILLIGDFTGMIGDPSDKSATRKKLTRAEVLKNCKEYVKQASAILRFSGENKALVKYNSTWLNAMDFGDVLELASLMTVDQMLKRDMFEKRMEEGKPIHIHEFMYPLMQGYDSVAMDVDGEVGGNDQTFNMLAGRDLLKTLKNKEKFVVATKLLVDANGKKMGKTEGNMVSLNQSAEQMYGSVMSWSDNLIINGLEIVTTLPMSDIASIKSSLEAGANPRDAKARLALEIVTTFHGKEAAARAEQAFSNTFKKGDMPEDAPEAVVARGTLLADILLEKGLVQSKGELRRLIEGHGLGDIEGNEISDFAYKVESDVDLRIGKKRFLKVRVK